MKLPNSTSILTATVGLAIVFSTTFAGDFYVFNVPAFFVSFIALLLYRSAIRIGPTTVEITSQLAAAVLLLSIALWNADDISGYYLSFATIVLYINVLPLFKRLIDNSATPTILLILLGAALIASILSVSLGERRASVVFGPNVYYRVIGLLTMLFLLANYQHKQYGKLTIFALAASIVTIMATGSRGGLGVILFIVAFVMIQSYKAEQINRLSGHIFRFLPVASLGLYFVWDRIYAVFWRMFYFSEDNASLVTRIDFLVTTKQYLVDANLAQIIFGDGESKRVFSFYPHNIFAEVFVYHGIVLTMFCLAFFFLVVGAILTDVNERLETTNLILLVAPIFIGSQFSGSLVESFPVVSLALAILVHKFFTSRRPTARFL